MLEVIGLENEGKWLDIVKRFKDCDVYYLPQYTKAFQLHGDGEPMLFHFESENMKAINVVMKRDITDCEYFSHVCEKNDCFDIATPYGYGGFLVEGDSSGKALELLNDAYTAYFSSHGIVSEFVRFHPLLKNYCGMEAIYDTTELGKTISIDLSSPEVICDNIEAKVCKRIKEAKASGIEIFTGNTRDLYSVFKDLYDKTMDKNNASPYYYFGESFYQSVMTDLKDNSVIFYAMLNGEIIAIEIDLFYNQYMHSHLQGSKAEFLHLSPVTLLRYEAALWGCENGKKALHIGGGVGAQNDSLYRFKRSFNKKSDNTFAIGKKIFDNKKYEHLIELRKKDPNFVSNPDFFPVYRA